VAASASGDFVVAWTGYAQDGSSYGVFARRFSSAGDPLASELQVNTYTAGSQQLPSVAAHPGGDFVVAWMSSDQDGSFSGVFARRFSSAGPPLASEFQVNTYTPSFQEGPSVAAGAGGSFVVAWLSLYQDGSEDGVFAQRFAWIALDIDGDGSVQPLTDGLLVLRALFGFTGAGLFLDVDDSNMTEPLTDGLLRLRYLFGFTDTALTGGAVGGDCSRCDAPSIKAYLLGLTT
jgi:hypothetical protein